MVENLALISLSNSLRWIRSLRVRNGSVLICLEAAASDVAEVYNRDMDAPARLNKVDEVTDQIRQLAESNESVSVLFVRQSLHGRMHAHLSSVNEM